MKILYETNKLKIEFEYELARLTEKSNGNVLLEEEFYGEPNCGLIDANNKWAIIAGIHLTFWKPKETKKYQNESFNHIHSLRMKKNNIVEVLTDPWGKEPAIWELNINTSELKKIKDFIKYKNKEYTDFIEW